MKQHLANHKHKYIIGILTLLFLLFFFIKDGVIVKADTQGYLNMSISREAGYPLFLLLFQGIFGEDYQIFVVAFQMLLLGYSVYALTFTTVSLWKLKSFSAYVIWLVQICFILLCRYGSGFKAVYASLLLTEGLTYSLYALFIKTILQLNRKITGKRLAECLLYCGLLTFIRTQLMVSFFALIAFFVIKAVFGKVTFRKFAGIVIGAVAVILLVCAGERIYIKALYDVNTGTAGGSTFLLTAGLYGADEEDAELFDVPEEKYIFEELYKITDSYGANRKYEPESGFLKSAVYYTSKFDIIKFDICSPWFYEYFIGQGITDETEIILKIDEAGKIVGKKLFLDNIGVKIKIFVQECVQGYMRTIAKSSVILLPFVVMVYICYVALMFLCFRKKETAEAGWNGLFVLIIMTGNIFVTAFMIFCEPRYVLYNMVPFYVMGYLMLVQIYRQKKERQNSDSCIMSNNME